MATMKDIAEASGVSVATVSYVLNNRSGTYSPETRERVLKAMRDLNYRPSPLFRRKHASRSNTIGVLHIYSKVNIRDRRYPYILSLIDGILTSTTALQWNVTLFTHGNWSDMPRTLRTYIDGRCDGLLLVSPPLDSPLIAALIERGFPFVVINGGTAAPGISFVDVDNVAAAKLATNHLIELGHRKIAMLPGGVEHLHSHERIEGYRAALAEADIYCQPEWIVSGIYSERSGLERGTKLLSQAEETRPTAVFCGNDSIARGVLAAAAALGLGVPEDISIIGFDDSVLHHTSPALTSIRQPLEEMAAIAVQMLLMQIDRVGEETIHEILPVELIVRESTGPCAPS